MRRLRVDLVTRTHLSAFAIAVLVAGVASILLAWWYERTTTERLGQLTSEVIPDKSSVQESNTTGKVLGNARSDSPDRKWVAAARELGLPWEELFTAIEKARPPTVVLTSLRPDAVHGRVQISGQSASFQEIAGYIEMLGRTHLTGIRLDALDRGQGENSTLSFVVSAQWLHH